MNYRHAYHAGNFADLLKHAVLTQLMRAMTGAGPPLTVIDTHAGAGLYDLEGGEARRTGEGKAGIGALMAAGGVPSVFGDLKSIVEHRNKPGSLRFYPGSPLIIESRLRPRDRYIGCEFRADDFSALQNSLAPKSGVSLLKGDGWVLAREHAPETPASLLMLIDPPFERGDECFLASLLSQIEVPEEADQGREDPTRLPGDHLGDARLGTGPRRHPGRAHGCPSTQMGRTSMLPWRAVGRRPANASASSRFLASTR